MGCFNKIGFHSGLPIMDFNRIALFICSTNGENKIVSDSPISIDEILSPICLPLYGSYNDYGSICEIDDNMNLRLLSKLYGGNIEGLLESINEYSNVPFKIVKEYYTKNKKNDSLKKYISFLTKIKLGEDCGLCTTMELLDVYYQMLSTFNKPMLSIDRWVKGSSIGDFWLKKLGFTKETINHESTYRYIGTDYHIKARGYTPPSIMLGEKEIWSGYGGIIEFMDNFHRITDIKLTIDEEYHSYNAVMTSFEVARKDFKRPKRKTKKEISSLKEIVAKMDSSLSVDMVYGVGNYNIFTDCSINEYSDVAPFNRLSDIINKNYMCVYNNLNILTSEYRDIVCEFLGFNRSLSTMGGYYKYSAYGFQSINIFKDEFKEIHDLYSVIINNLTDINE